MNPGGDAFAAREPDDAARLPGGDARWGRDLADLHGALRSPGATVAVAESLTGGLLTAALTRRPGPAPPSAAGCTGNATA